MRSYQIAGFGSHFSPSALSCGGEKAYNYPFHKFCVSISKFEWEWERTYESKGELLGNFRFPAVYVGKRR